MALIDQYTASQNATFQHKVQQACLVAAAANIASTSSGIRALAQAILAHPDTWGPLVAQGIVTNATIATRVTADNTGGTATDAEIQSAVNSLLLNYVAVS